MGINKNKNLIKDFPEIISEWDYNKNKIIPTQITSGSHYKIWWICNKCNYEWFTTIYNRANGTGCPNCQVKSKGEKLIEEILIKSNIKYIKEYKFKTCKNKKQLPFDFYLSDYNICIEYNGKQHYREGFTKNKEKSNINFQQIQITDSIKENFCKNNNIKLIIIKYIDYKNVETIIKKELNINKNKRERK